MRSIDDASDRKHRAERLTLVDWGMWMKKLVWIGVCGLVIAGCGGGGVLAGILGSKFVGSYLGALLGSAIGFDIKFTVVTQGTLSGTIHDKSANTDSSLSGTIDDAGNLTASTVLNSKTVQLVGPVTLANGHLTGQLDEVVDGVAAGGPVLTLDAVVQNP